MTVLDDLRLVIVQLRRDWKFTIICIGCLAVSIAAVATVFSLANQVLLKPLPFHEPQQLVMVRGANYATGRLDEQLSLPDFLDFRDQNECFTELAAYQLGRIDLPIDSGFRRLIGFSVSDNFFELLQVAPYLGARLNADRQRGNFGQIMLGTEVWRRHFGSRADIVGETIQINTWRDWPRTGSRGYTVVGLLPDALRSLPSSAWFMQGGVQFDSELPYCLPLDENSTLSREFRTVEVIGRLKPNVTVEQAQADLELIAARVAQQFPETNGDWTVRVVSLRQHVFGQVNFLLVALSIASCSILLIGCGNAAHMVLLRFRTRLPTFAIQASLGATPMRLAAQVFLESALLVAGAVVSSVFLTRACLITLSEMAPPGIPRLGSVEIEWSTLAILAGSSTLCFVLVIGFPLRHILSANLTGLLSQASSTASQSQSSAHFMRNLFAAEVVLSYVLLVACGCGVVRMTQLTQRDIGFQPAQRLTMTVSLPQAKHEWIQNTLFCNEILRGARQLPGVRNAAAIAGLPFASTQFECSIEAEGRPDLRPDDLPKGFIRVVTDSYFETLQIPILNGRGFNPTDSVGEIGGNRTVIINKALADKCWPDQDPIGRRLRGYSKAHWMEVVGVVGDVRSMGVDQGPTADLYFPEKLYPQPSICIVLHAFGDPLLLARSLREVVEDADSEAIISDVKSLDQAVAESQALLRYALALITGLACSGLGLALVGVFLTTTYSVSRRRQELQIRIACGATPRQVVQLIVGYSMIWTVIGLAAGTIAATGLALQQRSWGIPLEQLSAVLLLIPIPIVVAAGLASLSVALRFALATGLRG